MSGKGIYWVAPAVAIGTCLFAGAALADMVPSLTVHVDHVTDGSMISTQYAVCVAKAKGHVGRGPDISPSISWSAGPAGTRSYSLFLTDIDSPTAHRDWMNKEGETLTSAVPRRIFLHWALVDIPADVRAIAEGAASSKLVPHGKPATTLSIGVSGLNGYTQAFARNIQMAGDYFGYDGPCPPWTDIAHHYNFTVYALSVAKLELQPDFTGPEAIAAMQGKILAKGEEQAVYTTNLAQGAQISAQRP